LTTANPGQERARKAGRGGIAVLGAKVFFVVSGLVQQAILPRAIGLAGYGALARVLALGNILNNVVIASSVQAVSRTVAGSLGRERDSFRAAFRIHAPLALLLAAGFASLAPALARFEGAPHITVPLALVALVVLFYGIYAPIVGLLNGRGEFTRQAGLDIVFAVIRTAAMVGVGWLFVRQGWPGVAGATVGFVIASACIVPLAAWAAFPLRAPVDGSTLAPPSAGKYLSGLWPLGLAQFFTNAVMQVDITLLGHFLSARAVSDVKSADEWVGVYRACQLFAFLPYQLLLSITQILFPMLAAAKAEGDHNRVRAYVERGARLAALACGLMVAVVAAIPGSVLRFAYTAEIADRGAHALRILALGQGCFAMLAIATTVLASLGKERVSARLTLGALGSVVAGCTVLTSRADFGEAQLIATAIGTSVALFGTLLVAASRVKKETGGFLPLKTCLRVPLALAIAAGVGSLAPTTGRLVTPVVAVGVALLYVIVLLATQELTRADAHALRALRGK